MDRKAFYDALRPSLGPFTEANVAGFELVLNEGEKRTTPLSHLAYVLATAWWESGKTMAPVEEAFYLGAKADAYRRKLRYFPYHGRGLVQLTWKENYRKASELVGVDLVAQPHRAMDPKISVLVFFDGMEKGWFTGKDLDDYIDDIDEADDEDLREFANARRVVNGTDRQVEIGKLALQFERALKAAGYGGIVPVPVPSPDPPPKPASGAPEAIGGAAGAGAVAVAASKWGLAGGVLMALVVVVLIGGLIVWKKRDEIRAALDRAIAKREKRT